MLSNNMDCAIVTIKDTGEFDYMLEFVALYNSTEFVGPLEENL
jgi:hypothetical protein